MAALRLQFSGGLLATLNRPRRLHASCRLLARDGAATRRPLQIREVKRAIILVVNEPGATRSRQTFEEAGDVCALWVVIGEVLGVLRRTWLRDEVDERTYPKAVPFHFLATSVYRVLTAPRREPREPPEATQEPICPCS